MKKYTRPTVEVVELSVKESLSALPSAFTNKDDPRFGFKMGVFGGAKTKNVSIYSYNSTNA